MKKSKLLVFILLFSFVINFLPKQALANEDKPPENKNKVVEEKKELGTLVLEKVSNTEKAYDILKDFLSENYSPNIEKKLSKSIL